jgi:cation diffusion facilitator CzcD-associated flavoprotein CzcO
MPRRIDTAKTDELDVIIVGAGFAGIYLLDRLRGMGMSVQVFEAGSGLGGVWCWNCYPGARVDSPGPMYQFSREDLWRDWKFSELYPSWKELREYFADGVRAHLGMATAGFPNLLFLYGPQSPNAFANGPTSVELQGDWVVDMLDHLRQRNWARFEATALADEVWRTKVLETVDGTLFPRADSWWIGVNIPGKRREMLAFAGGLGTYMTMCNECAERGYEGFTIG